MFKLLNPNVSTYWLWLLVAFAIILLLPCVPYDGGGVCQVAAAYEFYDYPRSWIFFAHCCAAQVAAIIATLIHYAKATQAHQSEEIIRPRYSIRKLTMIVIVLSVVFAVLHVLHATILVAFGVMLLLLGHPICSTLAGQISRTSGPVTDHKHVR